MTDKKPTFEEALAELEEIVRQLETGRIKLEEAVVFYEKGMQLKKICEEKLSEAKGRIDKLVIENGKPVAKEAFDVDTVTG